MTKLRIFLASPGDVNQERDTVSTVVQELHRTIGDIRQVELELIRWETHAWPDTGEDAQDVINHQIGEYDVLVGIMWKRFGTPTNRADSGTAEEFEKAYQYFETYRRPKIMFYFRKTPFYMTSLKEISQYKKVIQFRKKLERLGVLFWEYDEPLQFERYVREHLIKQILQLTKPPLHLAKIAPRIFLSCVREDTRRVETIYKFLKAAEFSPWLDTQDLLPGQDWKVEIEKAIHSANIFVVFISQNYVTKKGFVQKEVNMALNIPRGDFFLLPVRLDPVEVPAELAPYSYVDYFSPNGSGDFILAIRAIGERHLKTQ